MREVKRYERRLWPLTAVLALAVLACNLPFGLTPTEEPEGTEVGEGGDGTVPPAATDTPVPDVSGPGGCTLNAGFVADVTVPDDTEFAPGAAFIKTWRMRNTGTCEWETGTQLVRISGNPLGGPDTVSVPSLAADANIDISVNLTAPAAPGTYRSDWRLQSPDSTAFGTQVYVQIVVPAPATATPVPPAATPFGGGGRITYVSFRDGNAEIYVIDGLDDSSPARLTSNAELDSWPDWSPDRARLTFQRNIGSKPDIYVMEADGSFQTNLTNSADYDTGPDWSPDGTRIAFASDRAGGALQIWVMKTDGTGLVQLTDTPQLNSTPDWSPDGNRIAFESMRDGQREIYVMNSDGTGQTPVTTTGNNYGPVWSPDGTRIAFSSSNGLWLVNADGTGLFQLTVATAPTVLDMHPSWSPDGTQVVFDSARSGNQDLFTIKVDGTDLSQVTTNSASDSSPAWR